ncbi:DUF2931 family protein [Marinobacter halodurans]|uniref:DUF2931 family protein n=1 Tax=Marinobacter halodurans TaxID=2528979 RepID=A0ABY1ZFF7_9GAMM|nr:DUF2931 family protein [Marinobacter halodurans]TBW43758.1 DUF2931 family protein [Marinobacter halodurans]
MLAFLAHDSPPCGDDESELRHLSKFRGPLQFSGPRDILTVGLAPGGTIVVWIQNQIGNEIEIARMQANEIEGDPDDYRAATKRYLEANGDYLKKHGVPTTGW